ncbi:MAG: glycosyltransferase family 2 protein [Pseudomonadota bacterium]
MSALAAGKVIAVVVTYHPALDLLARNVQALAAQLAHVVVVDNSEQPEQAAALRQLLSAEGRVTYIDNHGNQGIAHALNRGAEFALRSGADWILTMDQDSVLAERYADSLLQFIERQAVPGRVASVGTPFSSGGRIFADTPHGGEVRALITSGNLLKLSALQEVGFFREEFFIDYVDFDLCFRLRKAGYLLLECHDALFEHQLGAPQRSSLFGLQFSCSNYSPLRSYYMSRNRMVFFRENMFFDPRFVLRGMRDMLKETLKIMLGERQKWRKLRAILAGVRDGLLMRLGKH